MEMGEMAVARSDLGLPVWLSRLYRQFGWVKIAGLFVAGVATFGMMIVIILDVASRNLLGESIAGSYEVVQNYFMVGAIFPALGYVFASGILPNLDFLFTKLRGAPRRWSALISLLGEAVILGLLVMYTLSYAIAGFERGMGFPAGGSIYPLWPVLFLVPFGFALMFIEVLFIILRNLIHEEVRLSMHVPADHFEL